ncbi:MAG: hypothetical protein Q4D42_03585 [Eubacteriales bacterium]|nr:hypothetical protein [Eubacteriales bacterium]
MKNNLYLIWILLAGVCGAALRGMSLLFGYEAESGLPVEGYLPATLLIALTAAVVLSAVLVGRYGYSARSAWSFEQMYGGLSTPARALCMLCGVAVMAVCIIGLLYLPEQQLEQATVYGDTTMMPGTLLSIATIVLWILGIVSGLCMLLLAVWQKAGRKATRYTGMLVTIPMFWYCLDFILVYHDNSGNPVLSDYSYLLLLLIAMMTSFYSAGSFLYSAKGAASRWVASAGIAVYLAFVHAGSAWIWMLRSHTDLTMMQWLGTAGALRVYLAVCVGLYLLLQLAASLRKTGE